MSVMSSMGGFKIMGLHEIIHGMSGKRKEEIWGLSSGCPQSLPVGKEVKREWLVK